MFYNTPSKGDDGLYFVQASSDEKCKCLVQLNGVTVSEMSGEMIFDMNTESNTKKINDVESMNLSAAHENCVEWFGKQLSERVINGAHSGVLTNGQMTVDVLTDPRFVYLIPTRNQSNLITFNLIECVMFSSSLLGCGSPKRLSVVTGMSFRFDSMMNQSRKYQ